MRYIKAMKYLAGVIKTFADVEKLCRGGSIEGHIDADSLRLRENVLPSLTLLPHQTAVIPRLLHMEINQIWGTDAGTTIASNIICYSEQFGTGKTRTMIAMICIAPLPLKSYPMTLCERKNGSYQ